MGTAFVTDGVLSPGCIIVIIMLGVTARAPCP